MESRIGNTPLVRLENIERVYGVQAKLYAKMEYFNPAGSIKDRVAKAIIDDAEQSGRLQAGGTIVEATSGNTGIGLAMLAARRGYKAVIVMPETMSVERRKLIAAYGAEIVLTDGKTGMQGAVAQAKTLVENTPNAILADQFNNPVCATVHYQTTGREIFEQCEGDLSAIVVGVGTGGTITGIGKYLKEHLSSVRVIAVEPSSSPLLSKGYAGAHGIQGIGANFIPAVLDRTVYDEVITVSDEDAVDYARAVGKNEGAFVGISSGAALAAAIQLGKRAEYANKKIAVIFPDSGDRYGSIL